MKYTFKNKRKYKKTFKKKYNSKNKKYNSKKKKNSKKGGSICDYISGNCTYSTNRQRGRYKSHETVCPVFDGQCKHITIMDNMKRSRKHFHFGKKRFFDPFRRQCVCSNFEEPRPNDYEDDDEYYEVASIWNDYEPNQSSGLYKW